MGAKITRLYKAQGKNGYVYMASVYTKHPGGYDQAFYDANTAATWLMQRGIRVFAPIVHTHPMEHLQGALKLPKDHAFWMAQDWPLVYNAAAVAIIQMPNWENSTGIGLETKWAGELGKLVEYFPWPLEDI